MPDKIQEQYLEQLRKDGWYVRGVNLMTVADKKHLAIRMERDVTEEVKAEEKAQESPESKGT